ncbi:MAG: ribonuclease III [Mycoplasmataceae bacterium]|nr:ribonuclease III [Mycoplasmataceae bacterium]
MPFLIEDFLKKHNIKYNDIQHYKKAVTHTTFSNENKNCESYEILELLGDSIIQAKSTIIILNHFENLTVGQATQIRSKNVDNNALAKITKKIGLNKYLLCSNNKEDLISKTKICADLFESLVGAIYFDLGDKEVDNFLEKFLSPRIRKTDITNLKDFKTQFQELIQSKSTSEITYKSEKMKDNNFKVRLMHDGQCYGEGIAKTKKEAENIAAEIALNKQPKKL